MALHDLPRSLAFVALLFLPLALPVQAQEPEPAPDVRFTDIPFDDGFVVTAPTDWFFWRRADFGSLEEADEQVVNMINSVNFGIDLTRPFISPWDRMIAIPSTPVESGLVRLVVEMDDRQALAERTGTDAAALTAAQLMQLLGIEPVQTLDVNGRYAAFSRLDSDQQSAFIATYLFDDRAASISILAPRDWLADNRQLVALLLASLRQRGEPLDTLVYERLTDEPIPARFMLPTGDTPALMAEETATPEAGIASPLNVCPDGPNEIAFVSNRDGDYELYLARADGSDIRRLTDSPGIDVVTAWSPDGRRLYFHSVREGGVGLFVMDIESGEVSALSSAAEGEMAAAASPDGSQIAYHRLEDDGTTRIYIASADGSDPQRFGDLPGSQQWPAWSPDGSQIAFNANLDGTLDIYVMNVDGTGLRRLTNDAAADGPPLWSPDGSQIAFWSERDNAPAEVYIMNADGSRSRQVTYTNTAEFVTSWSPDGRYLAVEVSHENSSEIRLLDTDGREVLRLTGDDSINLEARWRPCAPDGD
ncbi:MAG: hypothetical protein DIU68_008370 [Chloroflexota bacterium]